MNSDVMIHYDVTTHCVVIIGELSVGKSALCRKFFSNGRNATASQHHLNIGHRASFSGNGGARRRSIIHLASDEHLPDHQDNLEEDGANRK